MTHDQDNPIPDFIKSVRTLRTEREMGYEDAKQQAIQTFLRMGWPIPEWAQPKKAK